MDLSDSKIAQQVNRLFSSKLRIFLSLLCLCTVAIATQFIASDSSQSAASAARLVSSKAATNPPKAAAPILKYGLPIDSFQVSEYNIKSGQFLADILLQQGMNFQQIETLVNNAKPVFDVRQLRAGKPYAILCNANTNQSEYFIYEPNIYEYIRFDLNTLSAQKIEKPVVIKERASAGVIESSLWDAMVSNGMSFDMAAKMEDALQWSVDFNHVQKGDRFKLLYEQKYIDDQPAGIGIVKAALYETAINKQQYYAIHHNTDKEEGYYDLDGKPMKSSFLKSPVKYSRITSRFNLRRFHPVLKRTRPHYGTDYAAPYGTPIYAVGNGVVSRKGYGRGNGRFIKIKHDDTYATQYLHMQKFAKDIEVGTPVKQGQVIGYVGSTGLATGPHVCFRFWKNGRQVNHLTLKFPPSDSLKQIELPAFYQSRDQYLSALQQLPYPIKEKEEVCL